MYVTADHRRGLDGISTAAARVLAICDEAAPREPTAGYLQQHGIVAVAASGRQGADCHFAIAAPSLVILDLHLGKEDGLNLLRAIRARSTVPVIIVTGWRCDVADRVVGFELGADDYVCKPVSPRELLARVRAVLRRCYRAAYCPAAKTSGMCCGSAVG